MLDAIWVGGSGDWSDEGNWQNHVVPGANDSVVIGGVLQETVTGSSYYGDMQLTTQDLTLAGNFSTGIAAGTISDIAMVNGAGSDQANPILTIAPWSYIDTSGLELQQTKLLVEGELLLTDGSVVSVTIQGPEGFVGVSNALTVSTLSVLQGGFVGGNLTLLNNGLIQVDDSSSLGGGTIDALGAGMVSLLTSVSTPETITFATSIVTSVASDVTILSTPNAILNVSGAISGAGTTTFINSTVLDTQGKVSSAIGLQSSQLSISGSAIQAGNLIFLSSSTLNIFDLLGYGAATIVSSSGSSSVKVQGSSLDLSLGDASSTLLMSGSNSNSVEAGDGSLFTFSGIGAVSINCNRGSSTTVILSPPTLAGAHGKVIATGSGDFTVVATNSACLIDGTSASGTNTYFGANGPAPTTVLGGSGLTVVAGGSSPLLAAGGSGEFQAWAGTSGRDLLVGGAGSNTLAGRSGDTVRGEGTSPNFLLGETGGVTLDGSHCSGYDTIFSVGGQAVSTITGGSGREVVVCLTGSAIINANAAQEAIWAPTAGNSTIFGSLGNDTILAGGGSLITMNGSGDYLVAITGGGSSVNGANFKGSGVIFVGGSGVDSVASGAGSSIVCSTTGTLRFVGGTGRNEVWGGAGGHDTIGGGTGDNFLFGANGSLCTAQGAGTNYLQASGSNVTLNGALATGYCLLSVVEGAVSTQVVTGFGQTLVQDQGMSTSIDVKGGNVTVTAGHGATSVYLENPSAPGTLSISGYDANLDKIFSSGSLISLASLNSHLIGNDTAFSIGQEVIILVQH